MALRHGDQIRPSLDSATGVKFVKYKTIPIVILISYKPVAPPLVSRERRRRYEK